MMKNLFLGVLTFLTIFGEKANRSNLIEFLKINKNDYFFRETSKTEFMTLEKLTDSVSC